MDESMKTGIFTISLDFELHWGVSEHRTIESYGENLRKTPIVIERLLDLFEIYQIHATWATVGMLFCRNKHELKANIPIGKRPIYENEKLSNYRLISNIGESILDDPYHYALPLINKISQKKGQEIATHTYSHYYCLEKGQLEKNFKEDITTALTVAKKENFEIKSIVFPRNQYNNSHLKIVVEEGINTFRGNEHHWMYAPKSRAEETSLRRLCRLLDSYIKISGDNTYLINFDEKPINVPSSRFLRPFEPKLAFLDSLRLRRICSEMTYAAKNNRLFHLWWHPHNFGKYLEKNLDFLKKILTHYSKLRNEFNFQSMNMKEVGQMESVYE